MSHKGFVINNEPTEKSSQNIQFSAGGLDFIEQNSTAMNYELWSAAHTEAKEDNTLRCMATSLFMHLALFVAAALVVVPAIEKAKTETITIEIADQTGPISIPDGSPVAETKGAKASAELPAPAPAPVAKTAGKESLSKDDILVPSKTKKSASVLRQAKKNIAAKRMAQPKSKMIKLAKATSVRTARPTAAPANRMAIPKAPAVPVPETLDDIAAPVLDDNGVPVNVAAGFDDQDLNDDFKKVDRHHKKQILAMKKAMDAETDSFDKENSSALDALDADSKAEAAQLAALNKAQREKDEKALVSAAAAEQAAKDAAAREAAIKAARAERFANARSTYAQGNAMRSSNGRGGTGSGETGQGTGKSGNMGPTKTIAGIPGGVRSLDQLRQMPGNPRPRYDQQERFNGNQGEVSYVAFVTKEGIPTKFKMLKSTGYQNLDSKTLAALQKWKFYPGQEGWVEIPIKWDLEGGAQEMHARLRTRVSQN